jgi:RNA polymerase sigma-70 factor (ECF subfamily)
MHESAKLAARVEDGDEEAFATLFKRHYTSLYGFAAALSNDSSSAEDIVQRVFMRLWERRDQWPVHTSLRAYLFAAVRNGVYTAHKRRQVRKQSAPEVAPEMQIPCADGSERDHKMLQAALQEAIAELSPRQREVFLLCRVSDLSYAEISQALNISEHTVASHMARALRHLRHKLSDIARPWMVD